MGVMDGNRVKTIVFKSGVEMRVTPITSGKSGPKVAAFL